MISIAICEYSLNSVKSAVSLYNIWTFALSNKEYPHMNFTRKNIVFATRIGIIATTGLLLLLMTDLWSVSSVSASTWTATINSAREQGDDEYGYEHNDFGTITDRTFVHRSRNFTIDYIKWDDSSDEVEFRLEECLKPSDFVSLRLGSRTFSRINRSSYNSAYCDRDPERAQEFEFDTSSNPLPSGSRVNVTLTLRRSSTSGVPTSTPRPIATTVPRPTATTAPRISCTVYSFGTISGSVTRSGAWSSDCNSVNRNRRYARFYSFTVPRVSSVQIDLTSSRDTYLFLISGNGKGGSVIERNDDGGSGYNSRIIRNLAAGTYTIEATTYSRRETGIFKLQVNATVAPPRISGSASQRWISITPFFPTIVANIHLAHTWGSDVISGTRFNSFIGHSNSVTLNNYNEIRSIWGKPQFRYARTEVYANNRKAFQINNNQWDSTGIYPGNTDFWGGSVKLTSGPGSPAHRYSSLQPAYAIGNWGFWLCRKRGCPHGFGSSYRLNLWSGGR